MGVPAIAAIAIDSSVVTAVTNLTTVVTNVTTVVTNITTIVTVATLAAVMATVATVVATAATLVSTAATLVSTAATLVSTAATLVSTNRKAYHDYHILEKFEAGVELTGSEVKSLREGRANLKEGYVIVSDHQALLLGVHIPPYSHRGFDRPEPTRQRRLLLHKREIRKLHKHLTTKGLAAIPLRLYFNQQGWAKVEIALARGKTRHDKKAALKERDIRRETERELRRGR